MTDPENFPPFAIAFYKCVIDEHLDLAVKAFARFREIADEGEDAARASVYLNSALSNCASIARYFDPPRKHPFTPARSKLLREIYEIDENSALLNRDLRNFVEHLDERIDVWLESNPVGPIIPSTVFAHHSVVDDGFGHVFRVIDYENDIYVGLGNKFEYGGIARETVRLYLHDEREASEVAE
jgi:hypothetical protein